jgi:microcystin-dependent protein
MPVTHQWSSSMEPLLGTIQVFAFGFAPVGWAPCNGMLLPIQENTALYTLLGTTYGGDGQTSFALPKLAPLAPNGPGYYIAMLGIMPKQSPA